jgi:hypothetical protein
MATTAKEIKTKGSLSAVKPLPQVKLVVVAGILLVLVFIFYSGHLFGSAFLWEDFVEQEFPFRTLATSSLAKGMLPQWNPYTFCGMPFLADIQVAFWYPANMLQSLFVSDGHLSPVVMQWFIIMHLVVAGMGMYLLVKRIFKTDDWSALFSAIAYMFCGYLTAQIIHQMVVYQLALFPFIVLLFIRGFSSLKHSIGAGLLLGVMYLAGHPQTSLYLSFFLGCLILYEIGYRLRGKGDEKFRVMTLVGSVLPVVIAFGIFAIQFLPSQELAGLSRRDVMTFENSVAGGSLSFGHVLTLIMPRLFGLTDAMHQAKVPYWNGDYFLSWETAVYIGILPLFFGLVASYAGLKKKYVPFFAGMALFALLFSMGDHFFVYKIFFSFPLFDKLRTPARMMMIFELSMCILGGVGLSMVLKNEIEKKKRAIIAIASGFIALCWIIGLSGMISPQSFTDKAMPEAAASIGWASGLAAFPVLAMIVIAPLVYMRKLSGIALCAGVIVVTTVELFTYGMDVNKSTDDPRALYREHPDVVELLQTDQAKELSRANIRFGGGAFLKRNQGPYDRIQLLEGYNPLVLAHFAPECANSSMTMDLMNIKHRVNVVGKNAALGEYGTMLPRAKMYYKIDVRPEEEARKTLRTDSTYDYHNTLLLEEKPGLSISNADPASKVQVARYEMNEIEVKVSTAENGMLFLSEVNYPAWKATLDGKDAKIYSAFTTLRAVEVPKGEHTIVMRYESDAFKTGSMVTLATLILSLGGLGYFVFKKRGS